LRPRKDRRKSAPAEAPHSLEIPLDPKAAAKLRAALPSLGALKKLHETLDLSSWAPAFRPPTEVHDTRAIDRALAAPGIQIAELRRLRKLVELQSQKLAAALQAREPCQVETPLTPRAVVRQRRLAGHSWKVVERELKERFGITRDRRTLQRWVEAGDK
jgi:hypothetical protein